MNLNEILRLIGHGEAVEINTRDTESEKEHDHSVPEFLKSLREDIKNFGYKIDDLTKQLDCHKQQQETLIRVAELVEAGLTKGE